MNNIVTKEMIELYKVRNKEKHTWGDISVKFGECSVQLMINSDYGHFAYNWFSTGPNPKEFLCRLSMDYTMNKLTSGDIYIFDMDKNLLETKKIIIEKRRNNMISKEIAKICYDEMLEFFKESNDMNYVMNLITKHKYCDEIFDEWEFIPHFTKIKSNIINFWNDIWILFIKKIQEELKEEKLSKV